MKVETTHRDYSATAAQWKRCRDAYGGSDLVKAAGVEYLPKLTGQTDQEYAAYLLRAEWFGATQRTVDGLTGAVFRKPPAIEADQAVKDDFNDVTLSGVPFNAFGRQAFRETLLVGRGGVLVDMQATADVNARPYWVFYKTEQIINWRAQSFDGDARLVLVVLKECAEQPDGVDWFVSKDVEQYRVLRLVDNGGGGFVYEVTIWRKSDASKEWIAGETVQPMRRGKPLDFIPFVFLGPEDITPAVCKSPSLDLVDTNLSHYRTSADYEHGLHFCGLPTPWVAGVKQDTKLKIGSGTAWVFTDPQAKADMLEFSGQGLQPLEKAMDRKEDRMAKLGARMLESQKRDAEAAETLRIRQSGDHSTIAKLAHAISQAFTLAAQWHAWWRSATQEELDPKVSVQLSQDFVGLRLTAEEVKALMLEWQAGAISYETFYHLLDEGGWTRPGVDAKTEREEIEREMPEEPEEPPPAPVDDDDEDEPPPDDPNKPKPPKSGDPPAKAA